jgi:hypothetical protein
LGGVRRIFKSTNSSKSHFHCSPHNAARNQRIASEDKDRPEERKEEDEQFENACVDKTIFNPCFFKGYELEWQGYTLLGTGSAHECVQQVQKLILHDEDVTLEISPGSGVGGVEHPPLRAKFFAMSLCYFALDSLRVLSHPHAESHKALNLPWPTSSIEELYNALEGLCLRSRQGVITNVK